MLPIKKALLCCVLLALFAPNTAAWPQEDLPAIVKRISPAVVVVETRKGGRRGLGSGFFINSQGHIVTNYHVVFGADQATVKTHDGKRYPVKKVLTEDKKADLVLLAIDIPPHTVSYLEVTGKLPEVGEKVYAIGHPMGLEKTVSEGIVSAIRKMPRLGEIIQITAPISQGSSGGPVFNASGRVIGVARATYRTGQNLNFAVPGEKVLHLRSGGGQTFGEFSQEMPGTALEQFQRGRLLHTQKKYHKAVQAFQEAISVKPDFAEAYYGVGMSYGAMGRHQLAIDNFRQAVRLQPNNPVFHFHLGVAYHVSGDTQQAMEEYRTLSRLNPNLARKLKGIMER